MLGYILIRDMKNQCQCRHYKTTANSVRNDDWWELFPETQFQTKKELEFNNLMYQLYRSAVQQNFLRLWKSSVLY